MRGWSPPQSVPGVGRTGQSTGASCSPFLSSPDGDTPGSLLDPDTRLDRFTIIRHLGSGRSAHVYLARDEVRGREVALKVADLRPDSAAQVEARMGREMELRRRLGGHRNVLAVFDTHLAQLGGMDLVILSMEHADGGDLRSWLCNGRQNRVADREPGIRSVIDAARGLAALHAAGVVHCDVKPENIFCVNGVWKIGDLDRAYLAPDSLDHDQDGEPDALWARGTRGYMSPELLDPTHPTLDSRADVYSLGVVLREVLVPAGGATASEMMRIVERCLSPDQDERFQLVEHVIEALQLVQHRNPRRTMGQNALDQDNRWRRAQRCLAAGRLDDARRLCRILLSDCPHHPGARVMAADLDRGRQDAVDACRQLAENVATLSLHELVERLRVIVDLAPDHEEIGQLIHAVEERIASCRKALAEALALLAAGDLPGSLAAFDHASAQNPDDALAAEACVYVKDMAQWFDQSQRRITKAIANRRYRRALDFVEVHRHVLDVVLEEPGQILADLEGRRHPEATSVA